MTDTTKGLDQFEAAILSYEISDEAIEMAAGMDKAAAMTLAFCSGLDTCPAEPVR